MICRLFDCLRAGVERSPILLRQIFSIEDRGRSEELLDMRAHVEYKQAHKESRSSKRSADLYGGVKCQSLV
jgi:hypothetical protein